MDSTHIYDLVCEADVFLLDRLKNLCVQFIINLKDLPKPGFCDWMRAAWALHLDRLEQHLARYLAQNLEEMLELPEIIELIIESASNIVDRQETDTIILIDDVRYWINKDELGPRKLALLDATLKRLALSTVNRK